MGFIPGWLICIVTFPGVIVHEFAHQLFCRLFRVAVFEVCYFRIGNPAGFVQHEPSRKPLHDVMIGVGPFFVNTIVGALIAFPAVLPARFGAAGPLDFLQLWLGVSIAMHAFPSTGDAASIWQSVWGRGGSIPLKLIATPVVGIIYLGALGSFFWLDLIYGVAVSLAIPEILIRLLA